MSKALIVTAACWCIGCATASVAQIPLALVEGMPNVPQPWAPPEYWTLTRAQTDFIFSLLPGRGAFSPSFWLDASNTNFNVTSFGAPPYIGVNGSGNQHQLITTAGLVLSGFLTGTAMGALQVPLPNATTVLLDAEEALLTNYDILHGSDVWTNYCGSNADDEFWYQTLSSMLPLMVTHAAAPFRANATAAEAPAPAPAPSPLDPYILNASLVWSRVVSDLISASGPGPSAFNWSGVNFTGYHDNDDVYRGDMFLGWTEPAAAGGIAWMLYTARAAFGETAPWAEQLLEASQAALSALLAVPYCPFWENQLPYAALTASRINAEQGTSFDVHRLLSWVVQNNATPAHSPYRWGWGITSDTWGGMDVHGLCGSNTDLGGYAFAMDTFQALSAMLPIARYNASYARALGKLAANTANAARLFWPQNLAAANQSDWQYVSSVLQATGSYPPIAYEGLRKWGFNSTEGGQPSSNLTGPYGTGDWKWPRCADCTGIPTNVGVYGSAYVGLLGGTMVVTDAQEAPVLGWELQPIDYHARPSWPSRLYYNPAPTAQTLTHTLPLFPANRAEPLLGPVCVYDAVSQTLLLVNASCPCTITVPADAAVLAVTFPATATLWLDAPRSWLLAGGRVIDFAATSVPAR